MFEDDANFSNKKNFTKIKKKLATEYIPKSQFG